jgi:hypothetical protein
MEILKADRNYKRKCFKIYLLLAVIGGVLIAFGLPRFKQFVASRPPEEAVSILANSLVATQLLVFVPFGIYNCLFAWRVLKSEQFPPPGQKVFKDTLIHRGVKAKRRSYVLLGGGVFMLAFTLFFTLIFPPVINELVRG